MLTIFLLQKQHGCALNYHNNYMKFMYPTTQRRRLPGRGAFGLLFQAGNHQMLKRSVETLAAPDCNVRQEK